MTNLRRRSNDERGVTLILALVLLLAISLLLLGLANATSSDTLNAGNLRVQRGLEYAAAGATTAAIQHVRYSGDGYGATPSSCLPGNATMPVGSVEMYVDCVAGNGSGQTGTKATRVVDFYACSTSSCDSTSSVLTAVVTFEDGATATCDSAGDDTSTCGESMTVNSWVATAGDS